MRNFGHNGQDQYSELGINGKNSEFHAAMGLCNLKYVDEILKKRKSLSEYYLEKLAGLKASFPKHHENYSPNYSYFPVLFDSKELMIKCLSDLETEKIYCRRYFYPSLSTLSYVNKTELPVCDSIVERIICLPLYHTLTFSDLDLITRVMLRAQHYEVQTPSSIEADIAQLLETALLVKTNK
jgi:dTDP-4-amino-4,6-dideoxygalactose transaminase